MCAVHPTRLALVLALFTAAASSCGGGGKEPTGPGGGGPIVTQIAVSPAAGTVIAGQSMSFAAVAKDGSGSTVTAPLTWSSSDAAIATVTDGTVKGLKAGNVTISATSGAVNGTASVSVLAAVDQVAIAPSPAVAIVGQTTQLTTTLKDASGNIITGRTVTWSSSNDAIATVSSTGLATGKTLGDVVITASIEGKTGTTALTVRPIPVASVAIAPIATPLAVGEVTQLTATLKDSAGNVLGRPVTWTSSNPSTAAVSATGLVTAKAPGTTTITASAEGRSGTLDITVVTPKVVSVTVAPTAIMVGSGRTVTLTATPKDAAAAVVTDRVVVWKSSDSTKAKVSAAGVVTGVSVGTATITATSEGQSGSATVTVVDRSPPSVASLSTAPTTIDVTNGAQAVLFSARVLDVGGSGTTRVDFALNAPAGTKNNPVYTCSATAPTAGGTASNGVWSCSMTIPAGAPEGTWTISIVAVNAALNQRTLTSADLAAAGMQATAAVIDPTPDVTPPAVAGTLDGIPPEIDVTNASVTLPVAITLTDDRSGVAQFEVRMLAPDQKTSVGCGAAAPASGDRLNGLWKCSVTVPKGGQPGTWSVAIRAIDAAFNTYYSVATTGVNVISNKPDVTPPTVHSLAVSPLSVDVSMTAQVITATARLTDAESGVGSFRFWLTAPNNTIAQCSTNHPASGTPADGIWSCQVTLPPGLPAGDWVISVQATDVALNPRRLGTPELTAIGAPTKVTVISR